MEHSVMVDVKMHECFPTMISEFSYHPDKLSQKQMVEYIKLAKKNNNSHAPHTHSNNFLSGVYYLEAGENTSNIQFFDPRLQASVLQPRNNSNRMNSSMLQFNSIKGFGYIFPSWLQHWVPTTTEERISISWNIILRGDYGESGTLQNARI